MQNIDILNLEWPQTERDAHSIAPVIAYLRNLNLICVSGDIFRYPYYLLKYRPKILLISNFQGASINDELCRISYEMGIKVISLIAEGNIRESIVPQMIWGHNVDRCEYFSKLLVWSDHSERLILENYPNLRPKVNVTGATGFDRYKILPHVTKQEFLTHNSLDYKTIIGFAGWAFDLIHDTDFFKKHEAMIMSDMWPGQLEMHRQDLLKLRIYLAEVVKQNPDVLFLLRPHPGSIHTEYDEFKHCYDQNNVMVLHPRQSKYSLADMINICDVWGGYETTTALEAWLLGKHSFLVNPSGSEFNRDALYAGSRIITTLDELMDLCGDVKRFCDELDNCKETRNIRTELIQKTIGYADGKNHERAALIILEALSEISAFPNYSCKDIFGRLWRKKLWRRVLGQIKVLRRFRNARQIDDEQIDRYVNQYRRYL